MNKFYTLLLLSGAAISANAQQINGTFDADWTDCIPWDSNGNEKTIGVEPDGWHISNVAAAGTVGEKMNKSENANDHFVRLTNKNFFGQKIPAYLTLGTPWATAEVNTILASTDIRNADGGTWGGKEFSYHPDAISFDYQRDNSHNAENATVVAYLWNGSWTQVDVPANTAIGVGKWGSAVKTTMVNRDRNVLGMPKTDIVLGGDVTATEGATCVAKLVKSISESTNDEWKTMTIPFTYAEGQDGESKVENINVIFSANDYFGGRNNIVAGNSLSIDNVKLVYYHSLSALTATDNDGNNVELNFDPETYNYTVNSTYDEDWTEVDYTKKGVGASVDADYNAKTAQYVITVKGEDYDEESNPDAKTVYTIQYLKPAPTLSSLVVAGHEFISAGGNNTDFTATGNYYGDEVSYVVKTDENAGDDADVTVEKNYDDKTNTLTVTLKQVGGPDGVYTIKFEGNKKDAVYQIPNSDFEEWASDNSLSSSWNSFDTAAGLWASFASMSPMPQKIDGYEGNGVRIVSKDLWVAYANGNMTTGHINMGNTNPTDASNFNFTDRTDINGNLPFAGTPDAFEVYARFTPGTAKAEGTALQGRVQLILHGDVAYHDPEVDTQSDAKIASANVLIPETKEWTKYTGEFEYTGNKFDTQYLLASATTNPVPGASKDDQLDLDNLKLIYYHTLKSLAIGDKQIEGFDPKKTEYTVTIDGELMDIIGDIHYEKAGKGGYADASYDLENGVATIVVRGDDYSVNPQSETIYTITFKSSETGIGNISAADAKNHKVYTLSGVRVNGKPAAGLYIVDGKRMMVK